MTRYRITHETTYVASERVSVCHNMARLRPRDTVHQDCLWHELSIDPAESNRSEHTDAFGNDVVHFASNAGYLTLRAMAKSIVDVHSPTFKADGTSLPWSDPRVRGDQSVIGQPGMLEAMQFRFPSPRVPIDPAFAEYGLRSFSPDRPLVDALLDLTSRIHDDFEYDDLATTVSTPVHEVFSHRRGVCQDFAHLQLSVLRSLGIPARYVSGYIRTYAADGGERLVGAAASHAWVSAFSGDTSLGEHGWIDADPTNNKLLTDEYITLAWGRDYSDVTPLKGVYIGGGQHSLDVSVDVEPLKS